MAISGIYVIATATWGQQHRTALVPLSYRCHFLEPCPRKHVWRMREEISGTVRSGCQSPLVFAPFGCLEGCVGMRRDASGRARGDCLIGS